MPLLLIAGIKRVLKKLIKDPLLHFLTVGAAIFAVSYWLNPPETDTVGQITVSAADVAKMRNTIALVQGRPATDEEVNALIEVRIREEVMVREALAAGLDRDDTVVRNRLIEKMRFLTENVAEPPPPTDAELEAYFAAQADRFRIPALVTFEQVFFATERRGERTRADAAAALSGLRTTSRHPCSRNPGQTRRSVAFVESLRRHDDARRGPGVW